MMMKKMKTTNLNTNCLGRQTANDYMMRNFPHLFHFRCRLYWYYSPSASSSSSAAPLFHSHFHFHFSFFISFLCWMSDLRFGNGSISEIVENDEEDAEKAQRQRMRRKEEGGWECASSRMVHKDEMMVRDISVLNQIFRACRLTPSLARSQNSTRPSVPEVVITPFLFTHTQL